MGGGEGGKGRGGSKRERERNTIYEMLIIKMKLMNGSMDLKKSMQI